MDKNTMIQKIAQFAAHQQSVYAIHGNDDCFFTAGADKSVIRWHWNQLEEPAVVCKTQTTIYSLLALSTSVLAVGTSAGLLHIVNLESKAELKCLQLDAAIFALLHYEQSKQIFATTAQGTLYVIDAETFEFVKIVHLAKDKIRRMDICESRQWLALACSDSLVYILSLKDFSLLQTLQADKAACNVVKFHPSKNLLLTASKDAHLHIWNTETWELEKSIPAHNFAIYSLDFIENGRYFITSGRDKMVKLWNTETTEVITRFYKTLGGHTHSVNGQYWNATKQQLVTISDDRKIIIWQVDLP